MKIHIVEKNQKGYEAAIKKLEKQIEMIAEENDYFHDVVEDLNEQLRISNALRSQQAVEIEKLKERNRKLDVDLLRALFYAPSSPVSAQKAQEIEVWYGKFKQVVLAAKEQK